MNFNLIIATLIFLVTMGSVAWGAPLATYVAGFTVSGTPKPDETKSAIQALLLSRLASDRIAPQIQPDGAEIKISGSYLLSGSVFSLDAAAISSSGRVITRTFTQGKSPDELIPAVGKLAQALTDGIVRDTAPAAVTLSPLPSADIIRPARTAPPATVQSLQKLAGALNGLAVGRTLPDGERELFVTGNHTLRYYRQGAELKLMAEVSYKSYEKVLAVDSADLDNDNVPEIYVTVMNGEELVSQVWTVAGTRLKQVAGPLPYFFRAVTTFGGAKKLFAQKTSGTADFDGDVAEVVMSGGGYVLKDPVKLPKQGYLYNFDMLKGPKGEPDPVIVDRSSFLRVFNPAGDELWKSGEEYGGSEMFFKRTGFGTQFQNGGGDRQVFLDQRMIVKANGELLVPKNSAYWFLANKHSYAHSSLYCFSWNGSDLEEKWHTKQNDYYLADFAYDEKSHELLLLEVVSKEEGVFDSGASRLVIRKVD